MGVNLEWEVCESGGGAGEEWAGATMPSSAELLLPAERGFFSVLLAGLARLGAPQWGWEGFGRRKGELLGRRDCIQAVWLDQSPHSRGAC